MAQQLINTGTAPNAGDGDPLRTAFTKTNDNDTELYGYSADLSGVSNATAARTNLGLGDMATQSAAAVSVTGGTVNGASVGATVASSGAFTTLSSSGAASLSGLNYPTVDGTANQVLQTNGAGALSWTDNAGGIANVVDDITPQLGGNLDVNGKSIVSTANGDIVLAPNGTGEVLTGDIDLQSNTVRNGTIKHYSEAVVTTASASTAVTMNLSTGNVFDIKLDNVAACDLSLSGAPATGLAGSVTVILRQDTNGSRTVTWPTGVKWAGGTAPTLTTTGDKADIFTLFTVDAGNTWFGFTAGQDFG